MLQLVLIFSATIPPIIYAFASVVEDSHVLGRLSRQSAQAGRILLFLSQRTGTTEVVRGITLRSGSSDARKKAFPQMVSAWH
jgi:hypothetical protein